MTPGGPRAAWPLAAAGAAIGCALAVLAVASLTRALEATPGQNVLQMAAFAESAALEMRAARREGRRTIAYLGDSTVAGYERTQALPRRLQAMLDEALGAERAPRVVSVAYPAMLTGAYAYLADVIAEGRPDVVLWQTSFTHFSSNRGLTAMWAPLASWMGWARLPRALTWPLATLGVTADGLLLGRTVVSLGAAPAWTRVRDEQSRSGKLRRVAEDSISAVTGKAPERRFRRSSGLRYTERYIETVDGRPRYTAERERIHYGSALVGLRRSDLVLRLLGSGSERIRASGSALVVYTNPINLDNLERVGLLDRPAIDRSLAEMRAVTEAHGGRFVDLHALLPDSHFSDAAGHFLQDDRTDAPAIVLARLLPAVLDALPPAAED